MIDVSELEKAELQDLLERVREELRFRLVRDGDPETVLTLALETGFSAAGEPVDPSLHESGLVTLTGVVKDISTAKHRCSLWTVKPSPEEDEVWFWEDFAPSFVTSETSRVGDVRRTAAVHVATPGMTISRHSMTHDGESHKRLSTKSYVVRDTGNGDLVLEHDPSVPHRRLPRGGQEPN